MKRAMAAVLGVGLGISGSLIAFAVTGTPSGFESADGNMTLENHNGSATDWNCFVNTDGFAKNGSTPSGCAVTTGATQTSADSTSAGEVTWVKGQKFDTLDPSLQSKSTPPKDDFVNVAAYTETATSGPTAGDIYFYGAQIRAVNNGNSSGNIEFDKQTGTTTSLGSRVAGDRLIAYDFINGGTGLVFHLLTWIDSTDPCAGQGPACTPPPAGTGGTCFVKTDSLPCWGSNVATPAGDLFDGQSNQSPIAAADNGISGAAIGINQFAEFGVNLTAALGFGPKTCLAFPQQVWESRSSGSSFTSEPEDIETTSVKINNCGEIAVIKQTSPRGQNKDFTFTSNVVGAQLSAGTAAGVSGASCREAAGGYSGSYTLNDNGNTTNNSTGNTDDCSNVPQGTYTVSEPTAPNGYTFQGVTCSVDSASGSTTSTSGSTVTITLKPLGVVICVYGNQQNIATMATQVSTTVPVFPGVAVHDTATVAGNQTADTPSGTVTFFLCSTTPCSSGGTNIGTGTLSGSGKTASADSPAVNTSASPLAVGTYCFRAEWPGDSNYPAALTENGGANGTNECFTVQKIPTTTTTTPSVGSGGTTTFGSTVTDHAVVSATQNGGGVVTGTVTFFICNPIQTVLGACPDPKGTQVGSPVTTTDVGGTPPAASADSSASPALNMTGTWCWRAVYTPGGANGNNYIGSNDSTSGECFTVKDTTVGTSGQTWLPNDTATVTSAHGAPLSGTLSAQLFTGDNCGATSGSAVSGQLYTTTLSNAASPASLTTTNSTFTVSTSQSVSWLVTFSSLDPNVSSSMHCEVTSLTITN